MAPKRKYNPGDTIEGFTLVSRYRNFRGTAIGVFICPRCSSHFPRAILNVANGTSHSCGCHTNVTHGLRYHKVHAVYHNMKQRCYNPNAINFCRYGGANILVAWYWEQDFKAFYDYVTSLPSYPGEEHLGLKRGQYQLHRINPNGDYEEGNLEWLPSEEHQETHKKLRMSNGQ